MKKKFAAVIAAVLVLAMALPAYAAKFAPSVEQKEAPSVVKQENGSGVMVDFIAYDAQGNEIDLSDLELVITPYSKKNSASFQEIKDALDKAKGDIDGASDLTALVSTLQQKVDELIAADSSLKGLKAEDLVVCDLFNVSFLRNGSEYVSLADAGVSSLKLVLSCDGLNIALASDGSGAWKIVDGTELSGGNLTLTIDGSCPIIAFVREGKPEGGGKTSPQTGYESNTGIIVSVALCAAVAGIIGACMIVDKKRA